MGIAEALWCFNSVLPPWQQIYCDFSHLSWLEPDTSPWVSLGPRPLQHWRAHQSDPSWLSVTPVLALGPADLIFCFYTLAYSIPLLRVIKSLPCGTIVLFFEKGIQNLQPSINAEWSESLLSCVYNNWAHVFPCAQVGIYILSVKSWPQTRMPIL